MGIFHVFKIVEMYQIAQRITYVLQSQHGKLLGAQFLLFSLIELSAMLRLC